MTGGEITFVALCVLGGAVLFASGVLWWVDRKERKEREDD